MNVFIALLGSGKMMSPFFLLHFSDLDTASKWKGQVWLKILHSASLIQEYNVPDCYIVFVYSVCANINSELSMSSLQNASTPCMIMAWLRP